jgi:dihydrolipoamide dehydrogenase
MERYDLLILGGGPAGYRAAERAGAGGMRVALFERRALGGTCLNEGCIPTKALLYSAKLYRGAARGAPYGVTASGLALDHAAALAHKDKVVRQLTGGVAAAMKAHGVQVVAQDAKVAGRAPGGGFLVAAGGEAYEGARLLLATGSEPAVPPIPGVAEGLASGFVMTSREALALTEVPESLVVVGGGAIGLEMADYFLAAGARVAVVEALGKIAGPLEAGASRVLMGNLAKKGVAFRLGAKVVSVGPAEGVVIEAGGGEAGREAIPAQKVLLSVGRRPSDGGAGLAALGVACERGAVLTDPFLRTNVPGLYAAGDVNGQSMLAHTAYREAEVAVGHMLGGQGPMRYDAVPSVVYTDPEAAGVGLTAEGAAAQGVRARSVTLPMRYSGRYVAENEGGDGQVTLVAEASAGGRPGRLLGAHLVGGYASEIVLAASMMVESRRPVDYFKSQVFAHPTVGEALREALFAL